MEGREFSKFNNGIWLYWSYSEIELIFNCHLSYLQNIKEKKAETGPFIEYWVLMPNSWYKGKAWVHNNLYHQHWLEPFPANVELTNHYFSSKYIKIWVWHRVQHQHRFLRAWDRDAKHNTWQRNWRSKINNSFYFKNYNITSEISIVKQVTSI